MMMMMKKGHPSVGSPKGGGGEGEKKNMINPELWQACAGPLVNLPAAGTHVVYFPQGHSEQVAASMKKDVDAQIPSYPNLPSKLLCLLHNLTLHADPETDEVYAQMTLQPVPTVDKDALLRSDLALKTNKPQPEFFCKTLTASDTSTHGGFSVPRRAAEKIFPPLDFSVQPPAQELVARDLHDTLWTFRHIYRGQPKRHLLTTGWSLFVSGKRLFAGDSVLFIRDEKQHLLLGIRRANRQPTNLSSSVLSSDSMHIGILAAAAHAAANNSPFTVFYNPRASPSEFVIPLAKYYKAVFGNQLSLGMRFRMMFETEESGTRRYMGTITGISDLDAVRWKNSQWRNLQVGWDESNAGERRSRVSIWEIEPVTAPFFICPPPFFRSSKRPRQPGMPDDDSSDLDGMFKRTMPWLGDDFCMKDNQGFPGLSLVQWMNIHQNPIQSNYMPPSFSGPVLSGADISRQLGLSSAQQIPQPNNMQFNSPRLPQQLDQLPKVQSALNPLGSIIQPPQQQLSDVTQQPRQNLAVNQASQASCQVQPQTLQPQNNSSSSILHQQTPMQNNQLQRNLTQNPQHNHQAAMVVSQSQQQNVPDPIHHMDSQLQLQLLQKLTQQQHSILAQQSSAQPPAHQLTPIQDHPQRQLIDTSQSFPRSISTSPQFFDMPANSQLPQSNAMPQQQITKNNVVGLQTNTRFSSQPKLQPEMPGHIGGIPTIPMTSQVLGGGVGAVQSGVTDDVPSCSTSPPSTNNCSTVVQQAMNNRTYRSTTMVIGEDMAQSGAALLGHNPNVGLETMSSIKLVKELPTPKSEVKASLNVPRSQNHGIFGYAATQTDYLDTSSSATSVCVSQSQNEMTLQQQHNNNSPLGGFNTQSMVFREGTQDGGEVQAEDRIRNNMSSSTSFGGQIGVPPNCDPLIPKGLAGDLLGGAGGYQNTKDGSASSIVSQPFGVPEMTFESTMDSSFLNGGGAWGPGPQQQQPYQPLRSFTKVHKRGAVGRSIDITRYSGYEELKQDLARRFGIEGQLEGGQRVGWKVVYEDHENDVLLVGDDPWQEFVNCVRCIRILSPQEVEQMSLEEDFGGNNNNNNTNRHISSGLPNQACSSSDGGIA